MDPEEYNSMIAPEGDTYGSLPDSDAGLLFDTSAEPPGTSAADHARAAALGEARKYADSPADDGDGSEEETADPAAEWAEYAEEELSAFEPFGAVSREPVPAEEPGEELPAVFPRDCYINRELSWLQFNERVLEEAADVRNPLMERLNFLGIFQSNLDEFYMVRVGALVDAPDLRDDKRNMTGREQLRSVLARTGELFEARDRLCKGLFGELQQQGIELCRFQNLPDKTQALLEKTFRCSVQPLLSPQVVGKKHPFPFLSSRSIYALAALRGKNGALRLGIVPCETGVLPRLVPVPGEGQRYVLLEELIRGFLHKVFPKQKIEGTALIRVIRSADIEVEERPDDGADLPEEYRRRMEKLVRRRKKLRPVMLTCRGKLSDEMQELLRKQLHLNGRQLFRLNGPLDLNFIEGLKDRLRENTALFYPKFLPRENPAIREDRPVMEQLREKDVLLTYPYDSMKPVLRLLREAGEDPSVVSIRISLYRVAVRSKIVEALVDAAENGKDVTVVVELKARFDEENNIGWSRVLEQAGCRVIYGLDGLKVHAKLLLITGVRDGRVEYISHVGTGNFNEDTARVYSDLTLLTADSGVGEEVADIMNSLSLGEAPDHIGTVLTAPRHLRSYMLTLMDGEIRRAKAGEPAFLGFKLNSLSDRVVMDKLIEASMAGVQVTLLVRGICCLQSGVPGYTEGIRVYSLVGRCLEHSRIFIFGTGERRQVYIGSADFMTRNAVRRVEAAALLSGEAARQAEEVFFEQLEDNVKLRSQQPDGSYVHLQPAAGASPRNYQEDRMAAPREIGGAEGPSPASPSGKEPYRTASPQAQGTGGGSKEDTAPASAAGQTSHGAAPITGQAALAEETMPGKGIAAWIKRVFNLS